MREVTQCQGEGQGSCKRCTDNGKWSRTWMSLLYKIEGIDGCYCSDCVKAIEIEVNEEFSQGYNRKKSTLDTRGVHHE